MRIFASSSSSVWFKRFNSVSDIAIAFCFDFVVMFSPASKESAKISFPVHRKYIAMANAKMSIFAYVSIDTCSPSLSLILSPSDEVAGNSYFPSKTSGA